MIVSIVLAYKLLTSCIPADFAVKIMIGATARPGANGASAHMAGSGRGRINRLNMANVAVHVERSGLDAEGLQLYQKDVRERCEGV